MPRRRRDDFPGARFHIANRAVVGRRLFRSVSDARRFLSLVARVVRAGLVDLHAYALAPLHCQLVVHSRTGRLSDAMRRIQEPYARARNAERRTSGPLFAGRFRAKRLGTRAHQAAVVAYVHTDPALAPLTSRPEAWPFTSAALPRFRCDPPWLERLHVPPSGASRELVDRWLGTPSPEPEDLDDLLVASPLTVAVWLRRRAESGAPSVVLVGEARLDAALGPHAADPHLGPGLLRTVGGFRIAEVAARLAVAPSTAHARVQTHQARLTQDAGYRARAARVVHQALHLEYSRVRWFPRRVASSAGRSSSPRS